MANGYNKTGVPDTDFYKVGRGRLYGSLLDSNDKPIAWRDLGNCTAMSSSLEVETLTHQTSRQGLRTTDKEVILSQTANLSITLDMIEYDNLAMFFGADKAEVSFAAATPSNVVLLSGRDGDEYLKGKWFDLIDGSGDRVYALLSDGSGLFTVTAATTAGFTGGAQLTQAGGDYLIDTVMGRIFVTHNGTVSALRSGTQYLKYHAGGAVNSAKSIMELRLFQASSVPMALKLITENPANGDVQDEVQFHKVSLKGDGEFNFISEEFSTLPLTGVAESAPLADPDSPICTVRTYDDAGVAA